MNDKRRLYRGFHLRGNGETTITLNGEKIKGEWLYGPFAWYKPCFTDKESCDILFHTGSGFCFVAVIPETVGQWVTTDKNGKDVFDGDYVSCAFEDGIFEVYYDEKTLMWCIGNGEVCIDFDHCNSRDIELIGNKWKVQK